MTPAPLDIAARYTGITVLPGHNSPFGPSNERWDGLMLDHIYREAEIRTVSFRDSSTALTVMMQNKQLRRGKVYPGDAVFLSHGNYVGIVLSTHSKYEISVLVGWQPGDQGKRHSRILRLHRDISVLAVADPRLPVKTRTARPVVTAEQETTLAALLSAHPAVGSFVPPNHFRSAYARWQRYLGYPAGKVDGKPDEKSIDRLTREKD